MKKMQKMLIGLLALAATTGSAFATNKSLTGGSNDVTAIDCGQLANDIDIVLTAGVVGGIDCDTEPTIIGLSVCHQVGLTTERTVTNEAKLGSGDTATCATGLTEQADDGLCDGTVIGSKYPTATTDAGTVASRYPGNDCTATNGLNMATDAVQEAAAGS